MPYKSDQQRKWAHTESGIKALGKKTVDEYDKKTKGKELPRFAKLKKVMGS